MLIKIMDILAGLKMTIVSGIFLLCAVMCMVSGIESPIDPAWGAVIISGMTDALRDGLFDSEDPSGFFDNIRYLG